MASSGHTPALGGVEVAIGDHHVGAPQRRHQHLVAKLHFARDVEQELRARRERQVAGIAAEVADALGDARGERAPFAYVLDGQPARAQRLRHAVGDGGLAAAVNALEYDEHWRSS
jgi:hypothetical protein